MRIVLAAAILALAPSAAFAGPQCTAEPKDKWMSEDAMKAKVAEMGYKDIKTFKVSGPCYEIYGYTKDGKKAEVYFNPVTGEVVKANIS
ncbi:MAG: PepSY domain-containing protein [Ancylobacter novellus]|uniref:PepSY domain-containing protein n=1 Tax=Ancylobacter novellus TaxID=921 RepID=A0A2W5KKY4_ANCNO|nr:MAG: PepSY domain-containing protein [Ancylobacter novellus]